MANTPNISVEVSLALVNETYAALMCAQKELNEMGCEHETYEAGIRADCPVCRVNKVADELKGVRLVIPMIAWTRPMLQRFKKAYQACQGDRFMFDGHEFVKGYAKYLIEYLEMQFK